MLRVLLLGSPAVILNDQPVFIQRRALRSLLFYLACQSYPVGRQELMALFWPESPDDVARQRLREALSRLRAQLNEPGLWIVEQDLVSLNPANVSVDAREFERAVAAEWYTLKQTPNQIPLPTQVYQRSMAAVTLWRSPRFLAGARVHSTYDLDEWLTNTAHRLNVMRLQVLERLGYHAAATGDLMQGIYWLDQVLADDLLNENINLQILQWQRAMGLRSDALKFCARIHDVFKRETGGLPPPVLLDLCRKIHDEVAMPTSAQKSWPLPVRMQVPFVGRIYSLQKLSETIQQGGAVLVTAESGAGKTRLIQQFFQNNPLMLRLLLAQARQGESRLPFQPLIEMLRSGIRPDEWGLLDPTWIAALTPLMPELHRQLPAGHPIPEGRANIFEALRQLLLLVSADRPLLLFLDDAQWSDEATLAALGYLLDRQLFTTQKLLVLAARTEESAPALEAFTHSPNKRQLEELTLRRLTMEEIADIARSVLNSNPPENLVRLLAHDTGGNPLFVIEILRAQVENLPAAGQAQSLPITTSIKEILHARWRALNLESRVVLQTAAIIGQSFSVELLEQACELSAEQVVTALEALERAHLIQPHNDASGFRYAFIHEIFRELLLKELSLARRRLLHLRAARALQQQPGDAGEAFTAVVASHFEAGGDDLQAFHLWLKAAGYARRMLSVVEAANAYRRADDLLSRLREQISADDVYHLYRDWGDLAFESGDGAAMQYVYGEMRQGGERLNDPLLTGAGLAGLGQTAFLRRELQPAQALMQQSLPYLQRSGNTFEQTRAFTRLGNQLLMAGRFEDGAQLLQQAIDLSAGASDQQLMSAGLVAEQFLAVAFIFTGWMDKAIQSAQKTLRIRREQPFLSQEVLATFVLATAEFYAGNPAQSLELCQRGIEVAARAHNLQNGGPIYFVATMSAMQLGKLDAAWDYIEEGFPIAQKIESKELEQGLWLARGELLSYGDPRAALAAFQRALPETPNLLTGYGLFSLGRALVSSGAVEAGLAYLEQSIQWSQPIGFTLMRIPAEIYWADAQRILGRPDLAEPVLARVVPEARERGFGKVALEGELSLAQVYLTQGRLVSAAAQAQSVVDQACERGAARAECMGLGLLLQSLRAQGEPAPVALRGRLEELLAQMEAQARLPQTADCVRYFRASLLTEIDPLAG